MANCAQLLATNAKPNSDHQPAKNELICEAAYSVPVFWLMLFDEESIIRFEPEPVQDRDFYVSALCRRGPDAIATAKSRWPIVGAALGQKYIPIFKSWLNHVVSRRPRYLLCLMHELEQLGTPVTIALNAFSDPRSPRESEAWQTLLLELSGGWDRERPEELEGVHTLCGYTWDGLGPWETGEYDHLFAPPRSRTKSIKSLTKEKWWQFWK